MSDAPSPPPSPPPPREPAPPSRRAPGVAGDVRRLMRTALGFYGIVTLFAVGYAAFDWMQRDGAGAEGETFLSLALPAPGQALAGLGVGLALVGLVHVGMRLLEAVRDAAASFARLLGPLTVGQALALAALSSVAEELLFRGALWPHLGLWGTSFLFGLVHVVPRRGLWGYPLFAALAGLLFGLLRDGSDSVWPPILAHFTINALNLAWLGHRYDALVAGRASGGADA